MKYYNRNKEPILIAHFPGICKQIFRKELNELSETIFNMPKNLDIVSVCTNDIVYTSPLPKQLKINNYKFYNYLDSKNILFWYRYNKPKYVLESLKMCNNEYCLILDANDVAICDDLDNVINILLSYNLDILYNATIWMYPNIIIDEVKNRGKYGTYNYLNAGCCIGKRYELIKFYEEVVYNIDKDYPKFDSEQYYIRKVFNKYQDKVFFDYKCSIFQCWHKQEYRYDEDKCYLL